MRLAYLHEIGSAGRPLDLGAPLRIGDCPECPDGEPVVKSGTRRRRRPPGQFFEFTLSEDSGGDSHGALSILRSLCNGTGFPGSRVTGRRVDTRVWLHCARGSPCAFVG